MFGEGISREGDILDIAVNLGIVNKSGAWYAYEGEKIGQGRENAKQLLRDRPQLCDEIDQKVRAHYEKQRKEEAEKAAEQAAAKAFAKQAETEPKTSKKSEKSETIEKPASEKSAGAQSFEAKPSSDSAQEDKEK